MCVCLCEREIEKKRYNRHNMTKVLNNKYHGLFKHIIHVEKENPRLLLTRILPPNYNLRKLCSLDGKAAQYLPPPLNVHSHCWLVISPKSSKLTDAPIDLAIHSLAQLPRVAPASLSQIAPEGSQGVDSHQLLS